VELREREAEPVGVAAHLVEREVREVPVERRVLDALGHDGPRRLLEPRDELVPSTLLEQEHPPEPPVETGHDIPVRVGETTAPRLDVRPVDRERGETRLEGGGFRPEAAQALHLGAEGRRCLL
jgi:hypothetical protein